MSCRYNFCRFHFATTFCSTVTEIYAWKMKTMSLLTVTHLFQGLNLAKIGCLAIRAAHRNRTNTGLWPFFTGTRTVPYRWLFSFFVVHPVIIRSGWDDGCRTGCFIKFSFWFYLQTISIEPSVMFIL